MKYFAGLDVSLDETAICVVDDRIAREVRAASEPDALVEALQGMGLALERIGLEACSLTAWRHEGLTQAGLPAICIETRQANAAMKTMPNKTDRNDARALAQIMRTGWFRQVHVKSRQCRLWRSLLVARRTVLNEMRGGDALVMPIVEPLLTILATMLRELARLTKQVFDIVRVEKVCRRLLGDGARLSGDDRPAGSVPTLTASRCASWPHAGALPVGRDRQPGQDQPLRRRTCPHGSL